VRGGEGVAGWYTGDDNRGKKKIVVQNASSFVNQKERNAVWNGDAVMVLQQII